jgi:hypothetical protein
VRPIVPQREGQHRGHGCDERRLPHMIARHSPDAGQGWHDTHDDLSFLRASLDETRSLSDAERVDQRAAQRHEDFGTRWTWREKYARASRSRFRLPIDIGEV